MNYLDLLKTVYTKNKGAKPSDVGLCISLTRTLAKDIVNLPALRDIVPYLFYTSPEHYFYLLYFSIPAKDYIPKSLKIEKEEIKFNKFEEDFKKHFDLSEREMFLNKEIIECIQSDKNLKGELVKKEENEPTTKKRKRKRKSDT